MPLFTATTSAPVNIACIKYWGKRDTGLILPTNSSLSVTLDQAHLRSTTTSSADASFTRDRLWLNGKEEEIKPGGRMAVCIAELKRHRKALEDADKSIHKISDYFVHICSRNNFPTAAGLASSASGFAALVYSLATLYNLTTVLSASQLSQIARRGSGSACRSLFGGFVAWEMGTLADGTDSFAVQIAPRSHWPQMHALICVVSDLKKGTSSTAGMQRTVETSTLLQHRIQHVVPKRMEEIKAAILKRDFDTFATITMRDSNQFHAVALDTDPPIFYLNDVSRAIIAVIVEFNRASVAAGRGIRAAYTFDAGPNAVIYALDKDLAEIVDLVLHYFPTSEAYSDPFKMFGAGSLKPGEGALPAGFNDAVVPKFAVGSVKSLIHTRVGDGPQVLGAEEGLLGPDGQPFTLA